MVAEGLGNMIEGQGQGNKRISNCTRAIPDLHRQHLNGAHRRSGIVAAQVGQLDADTLNSGRQALDDRLIDRPARRELWQLRVSWWFWHSALLQHANA